MSNIDKRALREAAEKATHGEWLLKYGEDSFDGDDALIQCEVQGRIPVARIEGAHPESGFDADFQQEQQANAEFIAVANPATVLALLDELEAAEKRIAELDEKYSRFGVAIDAAITRGVVPESHPFRSRLEMLANYHKRIVELEAREEALRPVGVMSEKAFHRLERSDARFIALWPRPGIYLPRKRPEDGVIVYARTAGITVKGDSE